MRVPAGSSTEEPYVPDQEAQLFALRESMYGAIPSGAPTVQIVARGTGAALACATLQKCRLHDLVHAVVVLDAPFQGFAGCGETRCFSGEVRCCSLAPGFLPLRRILLPLEAPVTLEVVPDAGRTGIIRYLCLGSTPAAPLEERTPGRGGWMLDAPFGPGSRHLPEAIAHFLHQFVVYGVGVQLPQHGATQPFGLDVVELVAHRFRVIVADEHALAGAVEPGHQGFVVPAPGPIACTEVVLGQVGIVEDAGFPGAE
jgi:hypothetical protein